MSLRQRKRAGSGALGGVVESLRNLDAYAKPLDDFLVKTFTGGAVTLISFTIIIVLLISEFIDFQTIQYKPALRVDSSTKDKMQIFMNITFPKLPCYLVGIDVMDVSGEHIHDISHDIFKVRLDNWGKVIVEEKGSLGASDGGKAAEAINKTIALNYCGPCYGGVPPDSGCCNTCADVRKAYTSKGWGEPKVQEIEQCIKEGYKDKIAEQKDEGCQVHGTLEVNRVPGNVHVAPGASFQQMNMHVHDMAPFLGETQYYFSHEIHELRFGKMVSGMGTLKNPLDGTIKETVNRYAMFQYFLKVVSTQLHYANATVFSSNQYSVTEHQRDVSPQGMGGPTGLPGVFFNYEISPMQVVYTETIKPLSHFFTDVCTIIGGIFTVAGILDGLLYNAERVVKKKVDLGKGN